METTERTHFVVPDPHVGDLLKLAEAKIEHLEKAQKEWIAKSNDLEGEVIICVEGIFLKSYQCRSNYCAIK
jgi:hypothetical protein